MKITWFSPHFADGGVEKTILLASQAFLNHGHQATLVSFNINSPMLSAAPAGLRIVDLNTSRVLFSVVKFARYLRKERPDAVISAQHYANITAIAARKLSRVKTRLLVSERVATKQALAQESRSKRVVISKLMKTMYGSANIVGTNSREGAVALAEYLNWEEQSVRPIYNPVNRPQIHELSQEPLKHEWLDQRTAPVILAAGRLTPQKDFPTLLDALALVNKSLECRLIILGDGPERERLNTHAANLGISHLVDLHSSVSNPYSYMKAADLFVLSSSYEGMPNVLIEAQVCRTPIVSTACETGPTELLLNGEAGQLVGVGDAQAMSMAIRKALEEPEFARQLEQVGFEHLDRFDPEQSYLNHIEAITGTLP